MTMQVYRQLVRTFMNSGDMDQPAQKHQKAFYAVLGVMAVCLIMIPCCLLVGYFTYAFTIAIKSSSAVAAGLSVGSVQAHGYLLMIHFMGLFSFAFGFSVILNVFYFAGDIEYVLPLPIRPGTLVAAKFTTAYINESMMEFMIIFSAGVGFFAGADIHPAAIFYALVGVLTVPIIPLAYCGILCVIIMGLFHWIRNKDHVRKISGLVVLILVILAISSVSLLADVDLSGVTESLARGDMTFLKVMNIALPGNYMLARAMSSGSLLWFLGYLLVNAAVLAVFLLLADRLYYRGVIGITEGASAARRKTMDRLLARCRQHRPWVAYFKKDMLVIIKTPAFFANCIAFNLLWPVLFYVIYIMQGTNRVFTYYSTMYMLGNPGVRWMTALIIVGVSVLLTAANSVASSGITREGKHYYVMKYLPISYRTQLHVKALESIVISGGFMTIYIVALSLLVGIDNLTSWYYILISLLEIIFITYFGLNLDTINPKLVWDDELNALRGNTNVFFSMAYAMVIAVTFGGIMYLVYRFTTLPLWALEVLLASVLVAADIWMVTAGVDKSIKNLEKL